MAEFRVGKSKKLHQYLGWENYSYTELGFTSDEVEFPGSSFRWCKWPFLSCSCPQGFQIQIHFIRNRHFHASGIFSCFLVTTWYIWRTSFEQHKNCPNLQILHLKWKWWSQLEHYSGCSPGSNKVGQLWFNKKKNRTTHLQYLGQ